MYDQYLPWLYNEVKSQLQINKTVGTQFKGNLLSPILD